MKVSAKAFQEVEEALKRYEREVEATRLRQTTKQTYILHASTFVRWLKDDFTPGGGHEGRR